MAEDVDLADAVAAATDAIDAAAAAVGLAYRAAELAERPAVAKRLEDAGRTLYRVAIDLDGLSSGLDG